MPKVQHDSRHPAIIQLDALHHMTHSGRSYEASAIEPALLSNLDLLLRTTRPEVHVVFEFNVTGNTIISAAEAVQFSNPGTPVSVINRNRRKVRPPSMTVTRGPTLVGVPPTFNLRLIPGGGKKNPYVGLAWRTPHEWVLAPDTTYLIRMANITGDLIAASASLVWYEPERGGSVPPSPQPS